MYFKSSTSLCCDALHCSICWSGKQERRKAHDEVWLVTRLAKVTEWAPFGSMPWNVKLVPAFEQTSLNQMISKRIRSTPVCHQFSSLHGRQRCSVHCQKYGFEKRKKSHLGFHKTKCSYSTVIQLQLQVQCTTVLAVCLLHPWWMVRLCLQLLRQPCK